MDRSSMGTAFLNWHGVLPVEWKSVKLRHLLTNLLAGNWGSDPGESEVDRYCARIADFDWNLLEIRDAVIKTTRSYTWEQAQRFALKSGDILVEKSGGGEKHPVGRCVQYRGDMQPTFANFAMRLRPNEMVSSGFLRFALAASYYRGHSWKILNQTTGIQNLDVPAFRSSPIPLPALQEQEKIVEFLESKTAEIDALIEKLSLQMELLERYRRELIARTVTRGLNPDVPMRDSGIVWVGFAPAHWVPVNGKTIFARSAEFERAGDIHLTPSQALGVLSQEQFIAKTGVKPTLKLSETGRMRHVEPGDFVIHLRSFQGGLEYSKYRGKVSAAYTVITPRQEGLVDRGFFRFLFKSSHFISYLASLTSQLRDGQSINFKVFSKTSYVLPPIDEQRDIATYLGRKTSKIDSTVSGIRKQIELLGKYRKQVINDAVTGKVRVGEVA